MKNTYIYRVFGTICLLLLFGQALSAEPPSKDVKKKVWSCKVIYKTKSVLWLVEWGDKSYVKVFDERIPAKYSMDGLEKRWDWGLNSDYSYDYAVTLKPDLSASYYDFSSSDSGTANSKQIYNCTR